jgi:hypothetical protein
MTITAAIGATPATALGSAGLPPSRVILPFGLANIAAGDNATPASSTPVLTPWCGSATIGVGPVMIRSGSVTAIAVNLTSAAAGSVAIFGVYKNGTIINAAAITTLALTDTKMGEFFVPGTYTFELGDVLDVRVRTGSGWSATTVDAAICLEVQFT